MQLLSLWKVKIRMTISEIEEELNWGLNLAEEYGFPRTYDGIRLLREKMEKEAENGNETEHKSCIC